MTTQAALAPPLARQTRTGIYALTLLSIGHFIIDLYSSALGTFQPLLVNKLQLSLTQAGVLGGTLVFSSSLTRPVYGYLSDRIPSRLFTVLAPLVAGIFIASLHLAPSYGWALLLVLLGGAGIASFHPQASGWATAGVHRNRGRWMAVFISCGTLGMAVGPTFFSLVTTHWGFSQVHWAALPGLFATALLFWGLPARHENAHRMRVAFDWQPFRAVWKPLTVHYLLVVIRSIIQITFAQMLPLYLFRERGYTLPQASFALSAYLTCGALGGFLGGHLTDRWGGRRVVQISMLGSVPFLCVFFLSSGWLSLAGLALGGLVLLTTIPVNVVMAQQLVPGQSGTVSALMMGFAWGMAGLIFIPLTGYVSDHSSLHVALFSLLVFPVLGFFLTLLLDRD